MNSTNLLLKTAFVSLAFLSHACGIEEEYATLKATALPPDGNDLAANEAYLKQLGIIGPNDKLIAVKTPPRPLRQSAKSQQNTSHACNWKNLSHFGFGPEKIYEYFEKEYGRRPRGIAVSNHTNGEKTGDRPVTEQHGWTCKMSYGQAKVEYTSNEIKHTVIGEKTCEAGSDVETSECKLQIDRKLSRQTSFGWETGQHIGLETQFKTGISFIAEGKITASFDLTFSQNGVKSEGSETTFRSSDTVKPKKGQKVKISVIALQSDDKAKVTIPVSLSGKIGAHFSKKVKDHFHWATERKFDQPPMKLNVENIETLKFYTVTSSL